MEKIFIKSTFKVSKMDCPSEERMIRMKLEELPSVESMDFDLTSRRLDVYHTGSYEPIAASLHSLNLDEQFISSVEDDGLNSRTDEGRQRRILLQVLVINLFLFALEILTGFIAGSMGLVADSLDMLADSIVYALSLYAVGGTVLRKKRIAGIAGYFQLLLAIMGIIEVLRRFLGYGETPQFHIMIIISLFALSGNSICLYLLQRSKSSEAHMQASMIFTSNDVIINIGVIVAGVLVYLTSSKLPDLIIGAIIFIIVGRGAYRILRLSR